MPPGCGNTFFALETMPTESSSNILESSEPYFRMRGVKILNTGPQARFTGQGAQSMVKLYAHEYKPVLAYRSRHVLLLQLVGSFVYILTKGFTVLFSKRAFRWVHLQFSRSNWLLELGF